MANDFYSSFLLNDVTQAAELTAPEKAIYGLGSAVIAGGLSLVNSTTSLLSRPFSDTPDENNIDKARTIDSILGSDAAAYYRQNQTGIDTFGDIGASFIPGTLAIKGLRALQGAKYLTGGLEGANAALNSGRISTELSFGTWLRPTVYAEQLTARAKAATLAGEWSVAKPGINKAIAAYAYQGALEGVAFEYAAETFMNQSTLYDKDSLAKTMVWNPLLSASLGGIGGAVIGRFNVYSKGGINSAIKDFGAATDTAVFGAPISRASFLPAENIGLQAKRAEAQISALDTAISSGTLTGDQITAFTALRDKLVTTNENLFLDTVIRARRQDSNLIAEDIAKTLSGMNADQIMGIMAATEDMTNVSVKDMARGVAGDIGTVIYTDAKKVGRKSSEFVTEAEAISGVASLEDTATKAVRVNAGTKIYSPEEAANAAALGETVSVIRNADGTYSFPNGLGAPGLRTANVSKELKTAKSGNLTVKDVGDNARMPVVLDSTNFGMVDGPLYPTVTELFGQEITQAGAKHVDEFGRAYDFSPMRLNQVTQKENMLEHILTANGFDYHDAEQIWLRAGALAKENKTGVVDANAFKESVAYAESQLIAAREAGLGKLTLNNFGVKGAQKELTLLEAEIQIANRKKDMFQYLSESGASREEIESYLKIKLNSDGFEDIDKFVGLTLAEAQKARYVKANVSVAKADALLSGIQASQRQIEEARGYQMLAAPLGQTTLAQWFGLTPEKFPTALNLLDSIDGAVIRQNAAPGLFVNSKTSANVLGVGKLTETATTAGEKLAKDRHLINIAPTAEFVKDQAAVQELAVLRTLYNQRETKGNLFVVPFQNKTYVITEANEAKLTDLMVKLEKQQAAGKQATADVTLARIQEIISAPGVLELKSDKAIAHVTAMAKENHDVSFASRSVNAFNGRQPLVTKPNQLWFPSPDPLDNPFVLMVRVPGLNGAAGKKQMYIADKATFESKRLSLIEETQRMGSDLQGGEVLTTADIKRYKVARGEFEYEKDFLSAKFDNEATRKGVILGETGFDQKYFLDIEKSLIGRWKGLAQDSVELLYPEFQELSKLHVEAASQKMTTLGKARTISSLFDIDRQTIGEITTPYSSVLDVMRNSSREDRTAVPGLINRFTQAAYDKTMDTIKGAMGKIAADPNFVRNILDNAELDEISKAAFSAGANVHAAQMIVAATKAAGSFDPKLTSVISKINAISNFFTLRLDAMASVMNAVSTPITALPHFRQLINEVKVANGGKLTPELEALIGLKAGEEYSTTTGARIFAQKAREFFADKDKVTETLKFLGVDVTNYQHAAQMIDLRAAAFAPDATLATYQKVIKDMAGYLKDNRIVKGLESFADHSEAFTQYVTGRAGYEIALASGKSEEVARLFAAGFAQQTNNTVNFGARHSFYAGPAGMLLGLYQNYTRGMITRSLKFLDEGNTKSLIELAGLQGAIFGARGLPLFDFYNRKLLGENNKQHADAFSAIYGVNGQMLGDFISYGAGSSLLGVNFFTRGDLTPYAPTILPAPWDSPAAKTLLNLAKLGGAAMESAGSLLSGDVTLAKNNLIQAIEHNNINRPIGRMAAMLQGHSTTLDGKPVYDIWQPEARGVIGGLDLPKELSAITTLAAGFAGTSSFSEAVTKDVMYRMTAYQLKDKEARNNFSKDLRIELGKNGPLSAERYSDMTRNYIKQGGTPQGFQQIHSKAAIFSDPKTDPIGTLIKKDPGNNIYKYASIILGPQARMNPMPDAPVE